MITTKSGTEIRTRLTVEELREAFSTPRKYYEFLKKLHEQTETPFLNELELLEWVKREEAKSE